MITMAKIMIIIYNDIYIYNDEQGNIAFITNDHESSWIMVNDHEQ